MKAVIIAGGKGTRLRPLTNDLPKSIVPVINRPFIIHQIELLATHGIDEIIINLHYLSQEIKKVLGDGRKWGVKIDYSIESSPLGTAGAVKNAEEFFDSGPLIIFNGDLKQALKLAIIRSNEVVRVVGAQEGLLTLNQVKEKYGLGIGRDK